MNWTKDHLKASASALLAGTSLNCGGEFQSHLPAALKANMITEKDIDKALTRVLSALVSIGELDTSDEYAGKDKPFRIEIVCRRSI